MIQLVSRGLIAGLLVFTTASHFCFPITADSCLAIKQAALTDNISSDKIILFVQWQYPSKTTGIQALNLRQKIETEISEQMQVKKCGDWFAGDLGIGGANMLFETSNKQAALRIIHAFLKRHGITSQTVIAQRIATSSNEWHYQVIFPKNYKGDFIDY